jgi:hypothetical protein
MRKLTTLLVKNDLYIIQPVLINPKQEVNMMGNQKHSEKQVKNSNDKSNKSNNDFLITDVINDEQDEINFQQMRHNNE